MPVIFKKALPIFFVLLLFVACDNNETREEGDDGLADPDDEVITKVAPANQIVEGDVSSVVHRMDLLMSYYVDWALGEVTDVAHMAEEYREARLESCTVDPGTHETVCSINLEEMGDFGSATSACDDGGTKTISSNSLTFRLDDEGVTGRITGGLSIAYSDDCKEMPLMEASDGDCIVTVSMNGTATVTVGSWTFYATSSSYDPFDSNLTVTVSAEPLTVTVGSSTTAQNYIFSYDQVYSESNLSLDGTVEFEDVWFGMDDVATAVNNSTQAIACPE